MQKKDLNSEFQVEVHCLSKLSWVATVQIMYLGT